MFCLHIFEGQERKHPVLDVLCLFTHEAGQSFLEIFCPMCWFHYSRMYTVQLLFNLKLLSHIYYTVIFIFIFIKWENITIDVSLFCFIPINFRYFISGTCLNMKNILDICFWRRRWCFWYIEYLSVMRIQSPWWSLIHHYFMDLVTFHLIWVTLVLYNLDYARLMYWQISKNCSERIFLSINAVTKIGWPFLIAFHLNHGYQQGNL